jgi:hypothetical protein
VYVDPPTATEIDQYVILGDVYFHGIDESHPGLILTPNCDFAQEKCDLVHACALRDAWYVIEQFIRGEWSEIKLVGSDGQLIPSPLPSGKRKALAASIKQLIKQRLPRYHWLVPLPGTTVPQVLDFQVVGSVDLLEIQGATILAQLASPYGEQISARYASYMGRIGTDDFADAEIDGWISTAISTLFP